MNEHCQCLTLVKCGLSLSHKLHERKKKNKTKKLQKDWLHPSPNLVSHRCPCELHLFFSRFSILFREHYLIVLNNVYIFGYMPITNLSKFTQPCSKPHTISTVLYSQVKASLMNKTEQFLNYSNHTIRFYKQFPPSTP